MVTAVKEEAFELNADVSGITSRDLTYATADGSLQPIYEYPVPTGYSLVFKREHTFSAYIEDNETTPAECAAGTRIDVVIMDASKQNVRSVLNPLRYGDVKEFQDIDKLAHLDIQEADAVIAYEGERVCVRVYNSSTNSIDVSDSYYSLKCSRIRHTLFE